jgi:mannose-6-phosphate isomerase-like protein (cupin superfamily)
MTAVSAKSARDYEAWRISPGDSNRLALIFDPDRDGANFIAAIEIFDVGGKTPSNKHDVGKEMFVILKGEGRATCEGRGMEVRAGDSLLLKPGTEHASDNTGAGRMYCVTLMVPNDKFTALIRSGTRVELDDEDIAVLQRFGG